MLPRTVAACIFSWHEVSYGSVKYSTSLGQQRSYQHACHWLGEQARQRHTFERRQVLCTDPFLSYCRLQSSWWIEVLSGACYRLMRIILWLILGTLRLSYWWKGYAETWSSETATLSLVHAHSQRAPLHAQILRCLAGISSPTFVWQPSCIVIYAEIENFPLHTSKTWTPVKPF